MSKIQWSFFGGGETPHKKGKVQAVHPLFKNKSENVKV